MAYTWISTEESSILSLFKNAKGSNVSFIFKRSENTNTNIRIERIEIIETIDIIDTIARIHRIENYIL